MLSVLVTKNKIFKLSLKIKTRIISKEDQICIINKDWILKRRGILRKILHAVNFV